VRLRFDLVIVTGPFSLIHVREAWRADTDGDKPAETQAGVKNRLLVRA
jgi:hypothetical protein